MSLLTTLSISRQGLYTAQLGLQITGQNIANVNTQGYKRQKVVQANMPYGLGVTVQSIDRVLNPLAERRLLDITSDAKMTAVTAEVYTQMEELFNEASSRGLDAEFSDFFRALQDLAARPSGEAERATLQARAQSIGHVFEAQRENLQSLIDNQDTEIDEIVSDINGILQTIAELNKNIGESVGNEIGVNELLNDRDEWVRRLAEMIPIKTSTDENGNFALFIEEGMPLINGTDLYQLESRPNATNDLHRDIYWVSPKGTTMDVTRQMDGARLGGILEARDRDVPEQIHKLDQLAAEFVFFFNEQHRAGTGLDGVTDRNFFQALPVYTHIGKNNESDAFVSASALADETLLTLDDYEIRFTVPGGPGSETYEVVNLDTGAVVAAGPYSSGNPIAFDGLSVTISDGAQAPQDGDYFTVSNVIEAAANVTLHADIAASLDAIAAGMSDAPGDNRNALLLADMETANVAQNGTSSFRDMYQKMIVELGVAAASDNMDMDSKDTLLTQTTNLVESVSGVNIDEEATVLMAYQRAYQAASKVISVTDELLATIINMV